MNIVDDTCSDILLDKNGQPVIDSNGDFTIVSGNDCWKQDLRLETETEQGELFYETADGADAYGFGMSDFSNAEYDDLTVMEIEQRVRDKLSKRTYIDSRTIKQNVTYENGQYVNQATFSIQDSRAEYNIELSSEKVEVNEE